MGFSVSGAAAIIFASMFIAFGVWYTAADNSFNQITDAQDARTGGALEQANTDVEVASATVEAETLTVAVDNTGAVELSLAATDLLVDGEFVADWEADATVEDSTETDLWLPGETLTIELTVDVEPERIKVVTGSGVATTAEVET